MNSLVIRDFPVPAGAMTVTSWQFCSTTARSKADSSWASSSSRPITGESRCRATASGCSARPRRRHASTGLLLPGLISGSVIFEQIFAWPGLGLLGYEAILARDFPVILTLNFMAAALTLLGILVSDILYALVDPRIRLE